MKTESIIVKNEMGREKTAFYLRPLAKYPAPNIPKGEHRAYLQWQETKRKGK